MRINKNTNNTKRNLIILSVVAAVLVVGGAGWYYVYNSQAQEPGENVVNYEPATDEQQSSGLKAKEDFNNAHYDNDTSSNETGDKKSDVGVLISSTNQNDNILTIASTIETLSGGVCELKLSRTGSDTVTMQVDVIKITTYSACEDFNVDVRGLKKGEWNVQVGYMGESAHGLATTKVDVK